MVWDCIVLVYVAHECWPIHLCQLRQPFLDLPVWAHSIFVEYIRICNIYLEIYFGNLFGFSDQRL